MTQERATQSDVPTRDATPSRAAAPASPSVGAQVKHALRGHDYATQVQMLTPRGGGAHRPSDVREAAASGISGAGGSLPYAQQIQRSFGGYDISNVQAHTDAAAANASASMGAAAYASGNHVVLGDSGRDLHTVAHEATHVVQQRAGVSLSGGVGRAGDPYERHADAVADLVVQGKSAEGLLGELAGSGGGTGVQMRESETAQSRLLPKTAPARDRHDASSGSSYRNPELDRAEDRSNPHATEYAARIASTRVAGDRPRPMPHRVGYPDYYLARHDDFLRRANPLSPRSLVPPEYYLGYGWKYAHRFTRDLYPKLSPRGRTWLIAARINLQLAIEKRLLQSPDEFVALEMQNDAFTDFCYSTHAPAYLDAGLKKLSPVDLAAIASTPDLGDLLSPAGIAQMAEVSLELLGHYIAEGNKNLVEAVERDPRHFSPLNKM